MPESNRFRWRLIAVTLSGFFGVVYFVGGLVNAGVMAYAYARFGRFPVRPHTPSLNKFAITPENLGSVAAQVMAGGLLLTVCVASWRKLRAGAQG